MKAYRGRRPWTIISTMFSIVLLLFLTACQAGANKQGNHVTSATITLKPQPTSTPGITYTGPTSLQVPTHVAGTGDGGKAKTTSTGSGSGTSTANTGAPSVSGPSGAGGIPGTFPHYFSFGAMNDVGLAGTLDSMRASNGAAFAFRYQYLTGGVNTGHGWETYNQPSGQYALSYMQESAAHGYIPAFAYYEICISNGPQPASYCGGHNVQQDTGNLANPTTMNAYFANWVLLMHEAAAFGKPVLIIVEPDLWAFLEKASNGTNNAANVPASVASSGFADAAGYPNTVQGFAWALLHMRDKYAPQAILALHASTWATGPDIAVSTTALDVAGIAQSEAAFLNSAGLVGNPAGVSSWDVLSNDVADFDSSQPGGRSWWDRYNQTFPNFARYLSFISQLSQATHRRVVMWQVPEGNQYFDTMNNTPGHYQDNRAEYILGNVSSFAAAGVIAVLFGPGNSGTINVDAQHDGITNPAPISSYECSLCNTHSSSYADDDGGYLRIFVGQYLQHPVAIS